MTADDLTGALARASWAGLFERTAARDAILAAPDAAARLLAYVHDRAAPAHGRFLAAELLFWEGGSFSGPGDASVLAEAYASALADAHDGGAWGMPGLWDGPATEHLVGLGAAALGALGPLLTSERPLSYTGSKRATLGELYGFRVKDVAAHAAASILGVPFPADESPATRDALIHAVGERLAVATSAAVEGTR